MAWDMAEETPQILNDGQNSYIYGPNGIPIEQINSEGKALYLHHDQQGSTRLLTGSTGIVEGAMTYDPYGNLLASSGTKTTPLGYDGQYTNSDTGLIDLRAREYDPATDQFLSVDPIEAVTEEPYSYTSDDPVNRVDPLGLSSWNPLSESFWTEGNFISESSLNPVPYFEDEIESYENGCGYLASVAHGIEGTVTAALDVTGLDGFGEDAVSISEKSAEHMFRDMSGHLAEDTPENRALIKGAVKSENYVGTHGDGVSEYRETLSDGTQVWARVYEEQITNGGLNQVPR